ncbi:MAG: hypothetical protein H6837_01065 [Planctomycetes bacterium]|nr:hypothetical protein [Planctomycetota bacterium]
MDRPPGAPPRHRPRTGLWLALILALSVGVFAPTLLNGFTYDDPHYARLTNPDGERNPMVASLQPFLDYWQVPMNHGAGAPCRGFRPVTVYGYALVNHFAADPVGDGEDAAMAHHIINLLLHGLGTLLVFFLIRPLLGVGPALVGCMVFGVHALHSGAVAAIVGRAELLAFALGAAATLLATRALSPTSGRSAARLCAAGVMLLLAFASKESAVAWVGFLPLYALARGVPLRPRGIAIALLLGLPLVLFLTLRQLMLATHIAPLGPFTVEYDANPLFNAGTLPRLRTATWILLCALGKTVWPCALSCHYGDGPFPLVTATADPRFLGAASVLLALAAAAFRARRHAPALALAAAAWFGFSFITSNLAFPIETNFGDRLFYIPVLGFALLLAAAAAHCPARWRTPAILLLAAWVAWNAGQSVARSRAWFDNTTLFTTDVTHQPSSVGLHIDLAGVQASRFDAAGSRATLRRAAELNPHSARALRLLAESVAGPEAEPLLRRALASPLLVRATEGKRVLWQLGAVYARDGRPAAARAAVEAALACDPFDEHVRMHLLRETLRAGELQRCRWLLDAGLALRPDDPNLVLYRAALAHHQRQFAAAAQDFARCLDHLPPLQFVVEGRLWHADSLLQLGDPTGARRIAVQIRSHAARWPETAAECARLLTAAAPR